MNGCCPKRPTVRVEHVTTGCLENAPELPEIPDELGTDNHTTDSACPESWELCADKEAARKLVRYVLQSRRWIRQVLILCGEPESEGKHDETDSDRDQ